MYFILLSVKKKKKKLLGKHLKISEVGKGECMNKPILALGWFARIMDGTNNR